MAKILVATPGKEMFMQAADVVEGAGIDAEVVIVSSQTVLSIVEQKRSEGAVVVVARGNHAHLIKNRTDMPLIEIVLSGQELVQLIQQGVQEAKKENPVIALIGFRYMFSDPEPFAQILHADVRIYYAASSETLPDVVEQAKEDGADVIIGGEIAVHYAQSIGMKTVFLASSKASLLTALSTASRVLYGIELEQKKSAEFLSLLNYSFDAILKLDNDGCVQIANYMAEKLFRKRAQELYGKSISELFEIDSHSLLQEAFQNHTNAYSIIIRTKRDALIANLASVTVDGSSEGFILSMQEFKRIDELEEKVRTDRYQNDKTTKMTFAQLQTKSVRMREVYDDAVYYAQYDLPVLIVGVFGSNKPQLAQCIHNAGTRSKRPYVSINMTGASPEMQHTQFSGIRGGNEIKSVFETAHTGTLFIDHVDLLDTSAQMQLLNVLRDGFIKRSDGRPLLPVNVRIIAATDKNLYDLVREGKFLEPLYCHLSQLELRMPTLRERIEDIPDLIESFLNKYAEQYRKFVTIEPEAQALIHAHPWEGDVLQLSLFLEKLVILARDKQLDKHFVQKNLPFIQNPSDYLAKGLPSVPPVYYSHEESMIIEALKANNGNRAAVAESLGISKTTLWRKMKKYGILSAFSKDG